MKTQPFCKPGRCVRCLLLFPALLAGHAQVASTPPSLSPGATLDPALGELRSTLAELHINKWKAPDAVRQDAQGNADSLARDLSGTLPPLLDAAAGSPQSVAAAFAVYRNIEAVYDVLLRVAGTAELAAPDREAADLSHALASLEAGRKALGEQILEASRGQEANMAALRNAAAAAAQHAAAAAPAPASTRVVSDGPGTTPATHKPKPKAKPAAKPASPPATPPSP